MIKGFTCGAFDLLHAGHIVMLKEAKEILEDYISRNNLKERKN